MLDSVTLQNVQLEITQHVMGAVGTSRAREGLTWETVRLQNSKKGHEVVFEGEEGEGELQVEKESSRDPRAKSPMWLRWRQQARG